MGARQTLLANKRLPIFMPALSYFEHFFTIDIWLTQGKSQKKILYAN